MLGLTDYNNNKTEIIFTSWCSQAGAHSCVGREFFEGSTEEDFLQERKSVNVLI